MAAVAESDNHVYVNNVKGGPVPNWIKQSGLTQKETARIQPTYGHTGGGGDISFLVFILPALVNVVVVSGLAITLGLMLFRSRLSLLHHNLGRKKFLAVMAATLLALNVVPLAIYLFLALEYSNE